jgi:hypothetical protein
MGDICASCGRSCLAARIPVRYDSKLGKIVVCSSLCKENWSRMKQHRPFVKHEVHQQKRTNKKSSAKGEKRDLYHCQLINKNRIIDKHSFRFITDKIEDSRVQHQPSSDISQNNTVDGCCTSEQDRPPVRDNIFVIADTNCFMLELLQILNLKHHEHVTVVVPFIVIQELDKLKKDEGSTGVQARLAIRALHQALQENQSSNNHRQQPWLKGQSFAEVLPESSAFCMNNDDMILQCALYYNRHVASGNTVLLTNDNALGIKAMMNNIRQCSVGQFLATLPPVYEANPLAASTNFQHEIATVQIITLEQQQREVPPCKLSINLWQKILSYLPPRQLPRVSKVCYALYTIVNKDDTVWKKSIQSTFGDINNVLVPKGCSAREWFKKWRRDTLVAKESWIRSTTNTSGQLLFNYLCK